MKDLSNHYIGHDDPATPPDGGCMGSIIAMVLGLILCGIITFFTGCTPRTIVETHEVPVYVHDTLTTTVVRYDSIHHRDSIYLETFIKGDTVHVNKYVEKWRTKTETKHDTITRSVETPVEVERTVTITKEVAKPLTGWQTFRIWLGSIVILLAASTLIVLALYLLYTYRPKRNKS